MMHIATVHWHSDRWIDVQLRYLERHLDVPYRIYAFLNDVPGDHASKYFYSSVEPIKDHATKLNLLGDLIRFNSSDPSDLVMFLDGDAFPIAAIGPLVRERLERHRLIAVQRYENNGDMQPHPCFCVTTVGFWHEIGGSWHRGHEWLDLQGKPVSDVGGNLLKSLECAGINWYPLRRVNRVDLHPVFFGVYGDDTYGALVYHHGAAFRKRGVSRVDALEAGLGEVDRRVMARAMKRLPKRGVLGAARARFGPARRLKILKKPLVDNIRQHNEHVMSRIERDEDFWRELV